MRIAPEQLTIRALLALEEAEKACGDAPLDRPYWVRFALAYLFAVTDGERAPFDTFWRAVNDTHKGWSEMGDGIQRRNNANAALEAIYRAAGVERTPAMMFAEVHSQRHAANSQHSSSR